MTTTSVTPSPEHSASHVIVEDPPFMRLLFGDTRFAILWLPLHNQHSHSTALPRDRMATWPKRAVL